MGGTEDTQGKGEGRGAGSSGDTWGRYAGATVRIPQPHWSTFFTRPGGNGYAPFNYELIFVVHKPGTLPFSKQEYAGKTARRNTPPPPPPTAEAVAVDASIAAGAAAAGTPVTGQVDALEERRRQLEAERTRVGAEAAASTYAGPPMGALAAADAALHAAIRPRHRPQQRKRWQWTRPSRPVRRLRVRQSQGMSTRSKSDVAS